MSVVYSARALVDLRQIQHRVAKDNPRAGSRIAVELVAACDRLEFFPERGRPGPRPNTREFTTVWLYVVTYRIRAGEIQILHIHPGRQEPVS